MITSWLKPSNQEKKKRKDESPSFHPTQMKKSRIEPPSNPWEYIPNVFSPEECMEIVRQLRVFIPKQPHKVIVYGNVYDVSITEEYIQTSLAFNIR